MTGQACRSCGAAVSETFIDLGVQPISNALRTEADLVRPEIFYPLHAFVCDACMLVQLRDHGPRETHFHESYVYFSSFSSTWLAHASSYAAGMVQRFALDPDSHVVEIASNDGYLLREFAKRGIPCLGIEPSASVASAAVASGIETRVDFFGTGLARALLAEGRAADLMPANNVLAHVPDLNDFVAGFRILLKPHGIATFEVPHLLELIRHVQFDTIYHEHFSYFSLIALLPLFHRHGLIVFDIERLPTHGGSLRVFVAPTEAGREESQAVRNCRAEEEAAGLSTLAAYRGFEQRTRALKRSLLALLCSLKDAGAHIAGYGAPAKGSTLLNYTGIRNDFLDFTVDRNPAKQGKFMPGTGVPILSVDAILQRRPDYLLILPWNIAPEIMAEHEEIGDWGGRFILPAPRPQIV